MGRSPDHGGVPEEAVTFVTTRSRDGTMSGRSVVMKGLPVTGQVDVKELVAFIVGIKAAKESGQIPHRGREGVQTGKEAEVRGVRSHRRKGKRGSWRS